MKIQILFVSLLLILASCTKDELPVSCFNFFSIDSINGGIQFENCSEYASEYSWSINQQEISTDPNPFYRSDLNFPLKVELIALNEMGTDTAVEIISEDNLLLNPKADFFHEINTTQKLLYEFKNTSINATHFEWDFGDGHTSNEKNPSHQYDKQNQKPTNVTLIAKTRNRENKCTKEILVIDSITVENVNFSIKINESNPKEVHFFGYARNAKNYEWNFGDGHTSSNADPVHSYTSFGLYDVHLKAWNEFESAVFTEQITVLDPQYKVKACFTYTVDEEDPFKVHFQNCSENATDYSWEFYDEFHTEEKIFSNEENPIHNFVPKDGEFFGMATLRASNNQGGYDEITQCVPEECQLTGKPNIYIYPEKTIQLQIDLTFPMGGKIDEAIPYYGTGWNIMIEPSGLIDRQYHYLYYECTQKDNYQKENGWNVSATELNSFFNENLRLYGFNAREIEDFTKYWVPRLNYSDHFALYPQTSNILNEVIQLNFSIQPNNIMRLVYVIEACNKNKSLPLPEIPYFQREGFVVMEWGVTQL